MWQVDHQCTQCGAAVVLDEGQRLFKCPFCRVKLYISARGIFQYHLAAGREPGETTFVPYWRFKGMAFSFTGTGVECGLVDVSRNATRFTFLPASLGLRSQTQKLRFLSQPVQGRFLERDIALEETLALEERFAGTGLMRRDKTYIGESTSVIYLPVGRRDESFYDGISGEMIDVPEQDWPGPADCAIPGEGGLVFSACLCPGCGADLDGEAQSEVLTCRNCLSAWRPSEAGFQKIPCSFAPGRGEPLLYLPFWHIQAYARGILETRADAVRLLNLAEAAGPQRESEPFRALVPAFKIVPDWFLRIAAFMTFKSGEFSWEEGCPEDEAFPATLPSGEAFESLKMVLAHAAYAKRQLALIFPAMNFTLHSASLVYLPFITRGLELIRPDGKFSISSSALKWGKGI